MLSIELKSSQSSRLYFLTTHLLLIYIIISRDLPNREIFATSCTDFYARDNFPFHRLKSRLINGQCLDELILILHGFGKAYILDRRTQQLRRSNQVCEPTRTSVLSVTLHQEPKVFKVSASPTAPSTAPYTTTATSAERVHDECISCQV